MYALNFLLSLFFALELNFSIFPHRLGCGLVLCVVFVILLRRNALASEIPATFEFTDKMYTLGLKQRKKIPIGRSKSSLAHIHTIYCCYRSLFSFASFSQSDLFRLDLAVEWWLLVRLLLVFFFGLLFVRLLDCYQKLFNMIEVRVHDMVMKVNDNSKIHLDLKRKTNVDGPVRLEIVNTHKTRLQMVEQTNERVNIHFTSSYCS